MHQTITCDCGKAIREHYDVFHEHASPEWLAIKGRLKKIDDRLGEIRARSYGLKFIPWREEAAR